MGIFLVKFLLKYNNIIVILMILINKEKKMTMKIVDKPDFNSGRPVKMITSEQETKMNQWLDSFIDIVLPEDFPSVMVGAAR